MKFTIFLSLLFFSSSVFASTQSSLLCKTKENGVIDMLGPNEGKAACLADLIWGSENVCYKGDANLIVSLMNNKYFDDVSRGYSISDANFVDDGIITFLGTDARSFWTNQSELTHCNK